MTVRSGGSVTSCVRTVLGHTAAAALMATSWSRATCAKPMCQVQWVTGAFTQYICDCIWMLVFLFSRWTASAHFHKRGWGDDGRYSRTFCQDSSAGPGQRLRCWRGLQLAQWHDLLEWHVYQKGQSCLLPPLLLKISSHSLFYIYKKKTVARKRKHLSFLSFARYILLTTLGITLKRFWPLQSKMSRTSLWTGSTSNSTC